MKETDLSLVERKVLGALLIRVNEDMEVNIRMSEIARIIGYKTVGGALSNAIKILEMKNYLVPLEKGGYKVLL